MNSNALLITGIIIITAAVSCKKNTVVPPAGTPPERKVKFIIYTTKDYSNNNQTVSFTLKMTAGSNIIWDSALAPIQLKDIPGPGNKLVIEKKVPGNNNAQLITGFVYNIENVGGYWYNDVFNAGETMKTIDFDFR
jgi:hypothetical protein